MNKSPDKSGGAGASASPLVSRHLSLGWWFISIYLCMGIALETMHGFKVDWYLNVANETRRLMFTLAHSHGTLLGVLHLAFAFTLSRAAVADGAWARRAGACLTGSALLLPGGFLLGGVVVYDGDPGRGVLLVPVGALLLLIAVITTAKNSRKG